MMTFILIQRAVAPLSHTEKVMTAKEAACAAVCTATDWKRSAYTGWRTSMRRWMRRRKVARQARQAVERAAAPANSGGEMESVKMTSPLTVLLTFVVLLLLIIFRVVLVPEFGRKLSQCLRCS